MLVSLNRYSNNGRGFRRWQKFKTWFEDEYAGHDYAVITEINNLDQRLGEEFSKGERIFVAAGGDGTVNCLLNIIMQMDEDRRNQLILGAIGLGSSNDFHKPFSDKRIFSGKTPFRLDWRNAVSHNVGRVDFYDENDNRQRKYFIINCSIGIIARANYLFNSNDRIINGFKSKWVQGTIWYAGLRTLFSASNVYSTIKVKDKCFETEVTNLSIVINPHFSGNFRYDFEVSPKSEHFGIALCEKMRIPAGLRTIYSLAKGKFVGLPNTRTWKAKYVEIYPDDLTPLELDGETYLARNIKITLLKGRLKVCT